MKYILYIDTSGDTGLVALSGDDKLLAEKRNTEVRNHASTINNDINEVVDQAGISLKDISAIAVCGGPGSYTGLRIGLSTAKAICYVQDIPLMMHNKLTLIAYDAWLNNKDNYQEYYASLPARAGEMFIAGYNNSFDEIMEPQHKMNESFTNQAIATNTLFYGEFAEAEQEHITAKGGVITSVKEVNISSWIPYSVAQLNCNRIVNLANAEPYYLKNVYTHTSKKDK